jgi:hypothetical protein
MKILADSVFIPEHSEGALSSYPEPGKGTLQLSTCYGIDIQNLIAESRRKNDEVKIEKRDLRKCHLESPNASE